MISSITSALLVLGLIIVIHELGHFLVAKFFKIRVETFSVGFGPRLFGFRRGDTDYRISAFPLGGYVKMSGENPTDDVTGSPDEFLSKPKWQRFLVAAAGPAMNIILAFVLMTGLYMYGTDVPEFVTGEAVVGVVEQGSPAEQAGVLPGDVVVHFDGTDNPNWQDVEIRVATSPERSLPARLNRDGEILETFVTPVRRGPSEMGYIGMGPLVRVVVRSVHAGSPAEQAGLAAGDEIIVVAGVDLRTAGRSIQEIINDVPDETFALTVLRDGAPRDFDVTPNVQEGRRVIGIDIPYPTVTIKLGFGDAVARSVETNTSNATLIFEVLGKLFTREVSMKSLDGPIGIIRVSGQAMEVGFATLVNLMALISLNLGLLNLLPIPILDGGVMLLLLVESVMGRDLSLRAKERMVQASFVFLVMIMAFVLYNDVVKLFPTGPPGP